MKRITLLLLSLASVGAFAQVTIQDFDGSATPSYTSTFTFPGTAPGSIIANPSSVAPNTSANVYQMNVQTGNTEPNPIIGVVFSNEVTRDSATEFTVNDNGAGLKMLFRSSVTNIPVRIKLDSKGTQGAAFSTQTYTAPVGVWQELTFNLTDSGSGSAFYAGGFTADTKFPRLDVSPNLGNNANPSAVLTYEVDNIRLITQAQLSVSDFQNEEFATYNTSNSLELNADARISDVKVYNISGQVVSAKSSNDSSVSVSTEGLSSGVYLVEATTVNGTKGLFKIAK